MGTLRVFVMIGATLCAGLSVAAAAGTDSQSKSSANPPLVLTPTAKPAKAAHHAAKARKPVRTARRHHAAPAVADEDASPVMRGADTFKLIARLPWWRSAELDTIRYRQKEVESQVISSTDAWFTAQQITPERDYALASAEEVTAGDSTAGNRAVGDRTADAVPIADPDAVNALDLAALDEQPPEPDKSPDKSWLEILLATLGAASTARFLFV
jgi:hypothetical protein